MAVDSGHTLGVARWWHVGAAERTELLAALLCILAIVGPLRAARVLSSVSYGGFVVTTSLQLADIPLALLLAVAVPGVVAGRAGRPATTALGVLVIWLLVALAVNYSSAGLLHVLRLAGAVAVAVAVVEVARSRHAAIAVRCLVLSTALQGAMAVGQVVNDGPLGLSALGENQQRTLFGNQVAGQGTFSHPYILVGWTVITIAIVLASRARRSATPVDTIAALLIGAVVGVTFSRAAALGLACAAPGFVVAIRRRPGARRVAAVIGIGAVTTALVFHDGWISRARQTTAAAADGSFDAASTGRAALAGDALDIARDHPVAGVGPTRYLAGLEGIRSVADDDFKPVHDVPLLVAAESGIPGALLILVLVVALAWVSYRAGPLGIAAALVYAPFVLLDFFPYYSVQGIVATGAWIGLLDALAVHRAALASLRRPPEAPASGP